MKKITALVLSLVMAFSMVACGGGERTNTKKDEATALLTEVTTLDTTVAPLVSQYPSTIGAFEYAEKKAALDDCAAKIQAEGADYDAIITELTALKEWMNGFEAEVRALVEEEKLEEAAYAAGYDPYNARYAGTWALTGGRVAGAEATQEQLDAELAKYGGKLEVTINADYTFTVVTGAGESGGSYDVFPDELATLVPKFDTLTELNSCKGAIYKNGSQRYLVISTEDLWQTPDNCLYFGKVN